MKMSAFLKVQSMWEPYSPDSLLDICIKYCLENDYIICNINTDKDSEQQTSSLREGISLQLGICERMLQIYQERMHRTVDDTFLCVFNDPVKTRLKKVDLYNSNITDDGLETVLRHDIDELGISNCFNLTERSLELINSAGSNILSLCIGTTVQIFQHKMLFFELFMGEEPEKTEMFILKTPNLRKLIFKGLEVEVPTHYDFFSVLLKPLKMLVHLDLSSCSPLKDLSCLKTLENLISLILYDVPKLHKHITTICQLKKLRHLDISQFGEQYSLYDDPNQILRKIIESLPHLTSLDISGTNLAGPCVQERLTPEELSSDRNMTPVPLSDIPGLRKRSDNPLEFLGLYGTLHEACYRHHIPAKKISGDANEEQIFTAAQVYYDRPECLLEILNNLADVFRYSSCSNLKLVLDIVLMSMNRHIHEKSIQSAGSALLYYIVRGEEKLNFGIYVKRNIIRTLLDAMCRYENDRTMLRNSCLTLIHFKISQDMMLEYEKLVDVLLCIVSKDYQDKFVQQISIYMLNSLACEADGEQKKVIGDRGTVQVMLQLIENHLNRMVCDEVMETAWSTMWNLTDETPANCKRFLDGRGMKLVLKCLKTFPFKASLLGNMMGLLGNVAEVKSLRPRLMTEEYIQVFCNLLDSTSDGIEVSYNAAGILSHIASDGVEAWRESSITTLKREDVLRRMVQAIERWHLDSSRKIHYRSFEPILRLLHVDHTPEAHHWAVWALANLTRVYPEKYCSLIRSENGIELLERLLENPVCCQQIRDLAHMVIEQCKSFKAEEINEEDS
ncbi:protein zer-1 homolog [Limulus polyphemus]|uniref:Protein zer-1 homolog n=1 Tax=Limulus polyphemus TaxID=6850 RepID=A0ABM1BG30_LIMPO|nr:protein zer-1 homolog [Limulus polyphemus]